MRRTRWIAFFLVVFLFFEQGKIVANAENRTIDCVAAGGRHTVFLLDDRTVMVIGDNGKNQCDTKNWSDVVSVAAGIYDTFGVRADGTVYAVGGNRYGQCDTETWTDIVKISASDYHTVGLKKDGTVVGTGYNAHGECEVEGWRDITQVATGEYFSVGLTSDGAVVTTGDNRWGQRNVDDWNVVAIDAGYWHTVGLLNNGKVIAAGRNNNMQCNVSGWADVVQISAGLAHTVALKADGTVAAVGDNRYGQCNVSKWHDICYVSAGMFHTIGVMKDGTLVSTGSNEWGQINTTGINLGNADYDGPFLQRKNNMRPFSGFLTEHPEYQYGAFLPLSGSGEHLVLGEYPVGEGEQQEVAICVVAPDNTVDTYYLYSHYSNVRYDPISHVLAGDTGGLDAYAVIIFSYEDDGAYYWMLGYELAWDDRGEEYYEYTKRKIPAIPNAEGMMFGESLKSLEYISEEEFNRYSEYYDALPDLVLPPLN